MFSHSDVVDKIIGVVEHRAALTLDRLPSNAQRLADGIRNLDSVLGEAKSKPKGPGSSY